MSAQIYDIPVRKITGEEATLGEYKGKVMLVVNVASKCGLTPQYEALENIYESYKRQGLVVVGFPANDFKSQEPGTDAEIQAFCTTNFGVKFPMFSKVSVTGMGKHPLYRALISAAPRSISVSQTPWRTKLKGWGIETTSEPEILWNFEKFLISRSGDVVARFAPDTQPDAPELVSAIEKQLNNE
jgi:glutathione peroxidase